MQVGTICNGVVQPEDVALAFTLNDVRHMFPRLKFDRSRITKRDFPLTREEDIPLAICEIKFSQKPQSSMVNNIKVQGSA